MSISPINNSAKFDGIRYHALVCSLCNEPCDAITYDKNYFLIADPVCIEKIQPILDEFFETIVVKWFGRNPEGYQTMITHEVFKAIQPEIGERSILSYIDQHGSQKFRNLVISPEIDKRIELLRIGTTTTCNLGAFRNRKEPTIEIKDASKNPASSSALEEKPKAPKKSSRLKSLFSFHKK